MPTLQNIAKTYQTMTGKRTTQEILLKKLNQAEQLGLVYSAIFNQQDEPIQTWRTNLSKSWRARLARAVSFHDEAAHF
jgi:hypothetical protein